MPLLVPLLVVLLAALLPLAALPGRAHAAAAPVRILVYGDSISHGSSGDWTWRYRLWHHLVDAHVPVDLVGPRRGVLHLPMAGDYAEDSAYADAAFDRDSGAFWGQAFASPTYDLANTTAAPDLVSDYRPDVVVGLIGFNDLRFWGADATGLADTWRAKIAAARAVRPGVGVVLVQQPDVWFPGFAAYNAALVALAAELDDPQSRVVATGDLGLDRDVDTYDTIHPTATGEVKIARGVAEALRTIGVGPAGGSWPTVANGPVRVSPLVATPGVGRVTLSWQHVPGVTRNWLEARDATAGGGWARYVYPFADPTTSWAATGLVDGHRYQFRLRPAKEQAVSAVLTSPVAAAVPGRRPTAVTLRRPRADGGGRLRVSWSASPAATSYAVGVRDVSAGAPWAWVARAEGTSATVRRLVGGHRYAVRVRADRGLIQGRTSAERRVVVPRLAPVTRVRATSPRPGTVRTSGRKVAFATSYRLATAAAPSCRRRPRATAFTVVRDHVRRPAATLRTTERVVWLRWYAVRDGVAGRAAPSSSACVRVQ